MNTNDLNSMSDEEWNALPEVNSAPSQKNTVFDLNSMSDEEWNALPEVNIAIDTLNRDAAYQAIREDNPLLLFNKTQFLDPKYNPEAAMKAARERAAEANSIVREPDGPALAMRVAKKAALAQYFAKEGQYTMDEAYEYFDQIAQKAFGRKMELNELWNTVRDIEAAKERPGIGERLTYDVAGGFMQLNNRMQDITSLAVNGVVGGVGLLNYAVYKPLEFFARKAGFNELADEFEKGQNAPEVFQRFAKMFREVGEDNRKVLEEHMRERPSPEGAVEEIASALITTVPDWIFGIGVGAATGGSGSLVYYGVGTFAGEWGDTLNDPNMNEFQKIFNATFCATAEVVFERFGTLPLLKKYFSKTGLPQEAAKAFAGSIMNGFTAALKNIGIDVVKEGGSEAATGIVQRLTNTLMNKGGADIRKMSASQIYNEIVSPAWSEFAVGGVLAGGTAALSLPGAYSRYKNYAEGKKALNTFLGQGNELARKIAAKENPTDAEVAALDLLHDGMDQNDPYAVIQAQSLLAKEEFEKQQAMDQLSLEEQADIALLQAKELRDLQERRKTEVRETDIENSVRSLEDAARDYAEGAFTIVRTVDELPESVQKQFARVPESQRKNIEAVYDPASGKVHLIAERITPSRAAKVAFHEVAVHKGLREAMGDHYGLFLEKIGKDFAREIEDFRNSSRGQAYSFASDAEVIEEFLANVGEDLVNGADRTLIDRIIDALRKFLRKFPKFSQLRYTQRELENIILASADQIRTKSGRFNTDAAVRKLSGENAEGRFSIDGKYFKNWQDVIEQFKKDLYGIELSQEQQDIYDVVTQQKDKIKLRINDLNELEDIFVNFGSRKKGVRKFISVHYAGLRNPVTALEVLNIGDVIRRGKIAEEGTKEHPTSRRYELQAEDGAMLKVIIDFNAKNDKNKSVINFYSDRKSNTGAHNVSSGIITDLNNNIPQLSENASQTDGNGQKRTETDVRFSVSPVWTGSAADYDKPSLHYVGSGEGQQAYGWGLYGSSSRKVGEWYADTLVSEYEHTVFFDGVAYKKVFPADSMEYEAITDLIPDLELAMDLHELIIDQVLFYAEYKDELPYSARDIAKIDFLMKNKDRMEYDFHAVNARHLYKQTFWPDKEENLLDWDKPLTEKQVQQIAEQGRKENLPFVYEENGKVVFNESTQSGKWVYETLCKPYNGLGSPKAVSEFLYRAGIDGVTYIGDSSGVRNYVAFSDEDIRVDEHIRFSLGNDSLAEEMAEKLSIRIMPIIRDSGAGKAVEAEIRTLLLEEGFNLDDAELKNIIAKAKDMVRGWQTRMRAKRDLDYLYEFDPYLNAIAGVYGDNFRIVPGEKYAGEEFTGTWINAKKNAVGIGPDEAARAVNAALGENITDDDIIDHFRDLRKKDILQKRNEEDRAFEEAMKTEELLRDQEMARAILHNEEPLTDEFIKNYPRAAKLVRDTFPNAEDWDAVRAGLQYNDVASWQEGRRTGRSEYRNLLKDAKKAHTDLKRVQELAVRYVKRNLPEEMQGAWLKRVADLAKYTPNPSIAYPNGRREFELQKLFDDLQGYEVKERIIQLADKYATKRNASGRPTAVLDEMQPVLENIRTALNLSEMAVQYMMEKNREKIAELEELGEDAQQLKDFNTVLSVFGALEKKSPEQLRQALDMLELVINGGLANFRGRMKQRMEQLRNARREVIDEAGGGTIGPTRFESAGFFKTATAKHLGLKHLLYWISEKSGKDFSETWGGKMWQETEDSTWDEQRRIGQMQKDWEAILKEIGVNTVKEQREFMQELNKKVEDSGVFKLQYSRENKDLGVPELRRKWTMRRISAKRARTLLADYDGGANPEMEDAYGMPFPVPNYSMEFLRRQLAAYDAGVDIMTEKFFGDPKDDAELARFLQSQKEDEKEKELVLITYPGEEKVTRVQIPLTKDSAMHVWLSWQQKDVKAGMEFNGWTNESIQELEKFLGPKYLDLAVKMRDRIRTQRQELDNAAREDYGVGLPLNENYFPASYKGSLGKEMKADALLGAQYGEMSMAPSFLIARKFHLNEVDTDSSAVSAFLGNQIEQAHYLAWRKTIREFKGVLNDRLVREAITQHYGKVVFDQLVDRVDTIAKGGRSTSDAVQEIAKFYKYWIPSKIALNFSSVAKQFAGVVNFVNDIPFKDFAEGYAESFKEGDLRNRFFDAVQKSDWLANRISGGLDKDLTFMLNSTRNIANYNPTATYLMDKVTLPTRWADTKSVLHGGYAVFKYHYNKMLKLTGDERTAWDEAMRQFQRSAEETQQSGALKDQNFYQSQAGMFRYLTAFMTNPAQIMAKEIQLINSLRIGTGARKESARKNLARMLVVNHLVMPILMEGITQFFRNGFDWDEYDFWDFLTGMLLGPFEAWLIAGKAVRAFSETLQREPSFGSVFQALPVVDDSLKGVSQIIRVAGMEDELEPDDWVKTVKALADLSLIAGSVAPGAAIVSAVGAGVSAGLREIRRIFRIFNSLTEED